MKANLAIAAMATAIVATSGALAEPQQWKHVGTVGQRHFVVVDEAAATDADLLKQAAAAVCAPAKPCLVAFWSDPAAVPRAMPMSRAQQQAVVAQYIRNPVSGKEELLLRCPSDQADGKCLH